MKIRTLLFSMLIAAAVLSATAVLLALLLKNQLEIAEDAGARSLHGQALATELIDSSESLTAFARNFTATGDDRYRRYYQQTLDMRNGLHPPPNESLSVYWQLVLAGQRPEPSATNDKDQSLERRMLASGVTLEEFALLKDAQGRSDALAKLEETAMNDLMGRSSSSAAASLAGRAAAISLLYSPEYYDAKASIMEPVALFIQSLNARLSGELDIANDRAAKFSVALILTCILLFVLMGALALEMRRRLASRGGNLLRVVERISAGDLGARARDSGSDEVALLANAFDEMVERLEQSLNEARQKSRELDEQRAHSEKLLHNILPVLIADRLKEGEANIAETFPEVTVMFADIVGFTKLSASMHPQKLVDILNNIFGRFDEMLAEFGLEKIKTIGDCYMVVGGVPERSPIHCQQVARFALAALKTLDEYNRESGQSLQMRMGIHAGTVVAGIVGKQKYSYDLWGDVVNIASRLESTSLPGRIHVASAVRSRLLDDFELEERGQVEIRGLGSTQTFFLIQEKAEWGPASFDDRGVGEK
ncbi:adenylate/guanylate cyclase domain-containing protein [Sandarakinorhabdus limnophila]|uniref:adenylate/guanylate cyclase domain-containing protein n=1 Tax=Sandarakinorhabdus limnophila TaxID=210512 RepID=UPI002356D724|nr:adenylate/guanylate cyclase domain-containing protein [Sandarakinorhabdus limnophila]